jgi:pimeloyl-ACP methyl ester carboxylesterase
MKRAGMYLMFALAWSGLFTGCDGKHLYDIVIDLSRGQSGLMRKVEPIGDHLKMAYLENRSRGRRTLVLVHGFGVNKEVWLPLAARLHRRYHLLIPDLVGDGESTKPMTADYSIEAQAKRLHRLISRLHIRHPVLVGNSMGGAISTVYASRYPTDGLVLIDPLGLEVEKSVLQKQGTKRAQEVFLRICDAQEAQRFVDAVFEHPPWIPGVLLEYMARRKCRLSALDVHKARSLYRSDGGWVFSRRFPGYARRVRVPTLILWGEQDKILNPRNASAFHRHIPHSQVIMMPGMGHVPMMEAPESTAQHVRQFVDTLRTRKEW